MQFFISIPLVFALFLTLLGNCAAPEDQVYSPPETSIRVLFLPFQEEDYRKKTSEEKKKSPAFSFGQGITENLSQLMRRNSEVLVVNPREIYSSRSYEEVLGQEKINPETIQSFQHIDWVVTGTFQYDKEKKTFDITSVLYDSTGNERKVVKGKRLIFGEKPNLESTEKKEEKAYYVDFIKNEAYLYLVKTILCERVKKEICPPLGSETLSELELSETKDYTAYLNNHRGLISLYESYHQSLNEFDSLRKRKLALVYFKRAILESSKTNQTYPEALRNMANLIQIQDSNALEMDSELNAFTIKSYNFPKEPLRTELTPAELERLRKVFQKALRFVKVNKGLKIQILGHWSLDQDQPDLREKNSRSEEILNQIFYTKEEFESAKEHLSYTDLKSEEDKVSFGIIKANSENGGN